MLPAAHRLRGDAQFRQLMARGRVVHGALFFLRYMPNNTPYVRLAFVVSGKVAKTIVSRNKLKRRMRAIVSRGLPILLTGYDILIVAKKGAPQLSFDELNSALHDILSKARLLKITE